MWQLSRNALSYLQVWPQASVPHHLFELLAPHHPRIVTSCLELGEYVLTFSGAPLVLPSVGKVRTEKRGTQHMNIAQSFFFKSWRVLFHTSSDSLFEKNPSADCVTFLTAALSRRLPFQAQGVCPFHSPYFPRHGWSNSHAHGCRRCSTQGDDRCYR